MTHQNRANTARMPKLDFPRRLKLALHRLVLPAGKIAFLRQLQESASILDVGCGNDSPYIAKAVLPHCLYVGLDVVDYCSTRPNLSDRYIVVDKSRFTTAIESMPSEFDAVVSSHNLEHCDDRQGTLHAMLKAVKPGGQVFLAFPSKRSTCFPSRVGTLNYFDDPSHQGNPPDYEDILEALAQEGFTLELAKESYQPWALWTIGLALEPIFRLTGRSSVFSWAFYGFESIIWARKPQSS